MSGATFSGLKSRSGHDLLRLIGPLCQQPNDILGLHLALTWTINNEDHLGKLVVITGCFKVGWLTVAISYPITPILRVAEFARFHSLCSFKLPSPWSSEHSAITRAKTQLLISPKKIMVVLYP